MKKYSIYDLNVVSIMSDNGIKYLICKYGILKDVYIEIFTNEKIKKEDTIDVYPLSYHYASLAQCNYKSDKPLMVSKRNLLRKYISINKETSLEQNKALEKATLNFFPKSGKWSSHCFDRPTDLYMSNLPCHLNDDAWVAKMFEKDQGLFYLSYIKILNFVKTSPLFKEKRHEYAQEIVKWQINYMINDGDNWIVDNNYGGDFYLLTPQCDLAFRKGIVDTLSKIGMNIEAIEEGIEKNSSLWRDSLMETAYRNEFEPIFYLINPDIKLDPIEPEHKKNWLKMRKYEYYINHKDSVDEYGTVEPEMTMSDEEVNELNRYLKIKNRERIEYIDEFKRQIYETTGQSITLQRQ